MTVVWEAYRVVSILCHFGSEPTNGHYQCLYISSGSSWLTDDNRTATLCPVMDPLRRAAYLYWLVPHDELSMWLAPPDRTAPPQRRFAGSPSYGFSMILKQIARA